MAAEHWTFGSEFEFGDVLKSTPLPADLGSWEFCERDIVNMRGPYRYVAADPLGLEPPVGGEINTRPTTGWRGQVEIFQRLLELLPEATISPLAHTHIHVRCPELLGDDCTYRRRLAAYVERWQSEWVSAAYKFRDSSELDACPGARQYLKLDGGRLVPPHTLHHLQHEPVGSLDSFLWAMRAGRNLGSQGMPIRYAINLYSLKHLGTVEFRCFRGTLKVAELQACYEMVSEFLCNALYSPSFAPTFTRNTPPMLWDVNAFHGWFATRWDKDRGTKQRNLRHDY